jgi:hypothetical protein
MMAEKEAARVTSLAAGGPQAQAPAEDPARCSVKTSWDDEAHSYSVEQLREIFALHGNVVDLVVKKRKSTTQVGVQLLHKAWQGGLGRGPASGGGRE